jgi:tetratricopeptide (TPR) repeat protein
MVLLAEVVQEFADYRGAVDAATRAIEIAEEVRDRPLVLRAELVHAFATGQVDPSSSMAVTKASIEAILDEAEALGIDDVRDGALLELSRMSFFEGKTAKSSRSSAVWPTELPRCTDVTGKLLVQVATTNAYFGALPLDEGFAALEAVREIRGSSLLAEAIHQRVSAGLLGMAGRFEEARASADRSAQLYLEMGIPTRFVTSIQIIGEMELLAGRLDEAERLVRTAHQRFNEIGETAFNSTICALIAHTLCDLARFDEAEDFVEKSVAMTAEDDFASQAAWRMAQARVLAHRGALEEAIAMADEAVAINERTDYLVWQGDSLEVRGQVLVAAGRAGEAREAFEDALARYERKGNVVAADRVRRQLEALGS